MPHGTVPAEHRRHLRLLYLHLDDLDDVHALLKGRTGQVSLFAGQTLADKADDLMDATRYELDRVKFVTRDPGVVVSLQNWSAVARTIDGSDEALAIINDVATLLDRRKHYRFHLLNDFYRRQGASLLVFLILLVLFIAVGLVVGQSVAEFMSRLWESAPLVAGFVIGYPTFITLLHAQRSNFVSLIPERRGRARHAMTQKRNAWLVGIASVILTVIGTFAVTYSLLR